MGYYTRYTLTQEANPNDEISDFIEINQEEYYAIEPSGESAGYCKWYEHDEAMIKLSKKFSPTLFKLHGEGEESGDIWDKSYLNGKAVRFVKLETELPKPNIELLYANERIEILKKFIKDKL